MTKVKQIVKQNAKKATRRRQRSLGKCTNLRLKAGSPNWTRTNNLAVNSRSLYH